MSDLPSQPASRPDQDDLEIVGHYPTQTLAQEYVVVVLAMGQPCMLQPDPDAGGFLLLVESDHAALITAEIAAYDEEQHTQTRTRPITEREIFRHSAGWPAYGIWLLVLVLVFLRQLDDPGFTSRFSSSSQGLFIDHQWWRPFTALFLHGDTGHLVGNLLSGMLFGTFVSRLIGPLRGWALILASGTAGNFLTCSLVWPQHFESIGASSAVFGALGILTGLGIATLVHAPVKLPWLRLAGPLLAGIVLLGWLGAGVPGDNTDVLGHVFGFSTGLAAGFIQGHVNPATADASNDETSTEARHARI